MPQWLFLTLLGVGLVGFNDHQFQRLLGPLALLHPLLGAQNFLLALFLVVRPISPPIRQPLLGFIYLQ